jgi:hypothetical protein
MQTLRNTIFTLSAVATLVVSLAVSCKQNTEEPNYCATSPGGCNSVLVAKEFFLFKPGSWWVYEEEYSGVRDSMYVLNYSNGSGYNFYITIKSALDGFEYSYWPEYNGQPNDKQCDEVAPVAKKCMNVKRDKLIPGAPGVFISEGRCMFFQYNLKDSTPSINYPNYVNNYIKIVDIKNNFQLGNFSFNETVKVLDPHDKQCRDHRSYHYFSKGVGLVRLELADTTETWNLVNYHIEP